MTLRKFAIVALFGIATCVFVSGCGDAVAGTYESVPEGLTLVLTSDGKASITMKGVGTHEGVVHVEGKTITINAGADTMKLKINDDGSLDGGGMTFKKK